jgi:hypothetical protein
VRIWVRELEGWTARAEARVVVLAADDRWAGVRIALDVVTARVERVEDVDAVNVFGFGVMLFSAAEGRRLLL